MEVAGIWTAVGVLIAGFGALWYRLGRLEGSWRSMSGSMTARRRARRGTRALPWLESREASGSEGSF